MIGLYTQNKNTEQELVTLLADFGVEPYQQDHEYSHLLWLDSKPAPTEAPILPLNPSCLPMTLDAWIQFFQKTVHTNVFFDNGSFHFDGHKRLLLHKKTHKAFPLTEKENELLIFLSNAPHHTASRQEILQQVWQYSPQVQTHTLESHIYALKQKIGKEMNNLLVCQDSNYSLIP